MGVAIHMTQPTLALRDSTVLKTSSVEVGLVWIMFYTNKLSLSIGKKNTQFLT